MFRPTLIAGALALSAAASHAAEPLQLSIYNADGNSFNVVGAGQRRQRRHPDRYRFHSRRRLSHRRQGAGQRQAVESHLYQPGRSDYYFGAAELKKIFPRAAVLSNGPTLAKIKANIQGKQAYWGPKMGDNAPTTALLRKS